MDGVQFHTLPTLLSRLDRLEEENAELLRRLDEYAGGGEGQEQEPTG